MLDNGIHCSMSKNLIGAKWVIKLFCVGYKNIQTGALWAKAPSSLPVCTGWSKPSLIKNRTDGLFDQV